MILTPEIIEEIERMLEFGPVNLTPRQPAPDNPEYLRVEGVMLVRCKDRRRQGVIYPAVVTAQ